MPTLTVKLEINVSNWEIFWNDPAKLNSTKEELKHDIKNGLKTIGIEPASVMVHNIEFHPDNLMLTGGHGGLVIPFTEKSYTKRELDFAYLAAVFNTSGLDGLQNEINRLKSLGKEPSDLIDAARNYNQKSSL